MSDEPNVEPTAPPPPVKKQPSFTLTYTLIALNVIVFAISTALGADFMQPTAQKMITLGGNFPPLTLGGEPWRLVSAMFLHYGILHIGMNMLCLWQLGRVIETTYGRPAFIAIYWIAGLAGGIATALHSPNVVSVGASGAIFGLMGAFAAVLLVFRDRIDRTAMMRQVRGVATFIGLNFLIGMSDKRIDMSAHIGGLIGGFVVGLLIAVLRRKNKGSSSVMLAIAVAGTVATYGATIVLGEAPGPSNTSQLIGAADNESKRLNERGIELDKLHDTGAMSDAQWSDAVERELVAGWNDVAKEREAIPASAYKNPAFHLLMIKQNHALADLEHLRVKALSHDHAVIEALSAKTAELQQLTLDLKAARDASPPAE